MEKLKSLKEELKTNTKKNNLYMFAIDGILITVIQQLVWSNVNLFAELLGATAEQLSFMTFLNQIVTVAILFPMGIVSDRVKNKRIILNGALITLMVFYFFSALTPIFGEYALYIFIPIISFGAAGRQLYLSTWNAFFKDATPESDRNDTMAVRTRFTLILGVIIPLITGFILSTTDQDATKVMIHQCYIVTAIFTALLLIFVLKKIRGGDVEVKVDASGKKEKIDLKDAFYTITHNKPYMFFMMCLFLFYVSWQIDWTIWYYGRVHYLELNEFMLSLSNVAGTFGQFIAIGFWKKINEKKGVRFGAMFGAYGLAFASVSIIVSTLIYEAGHTTLAYVAFMVIWFCANLPQTVNTLNLPLCLMEVVDPKYSALCISLFTILTTFTNAIMPSVGVAIYNAFGGDADAFRTTYTIIFFLRLATGTLWMYRWRKMKKEENNAA